MFGVHIICTYIHGALLFMASLCSGRSFHGVNDGSSAPSSFRIESSFFKSMIRRKMTAHSRRTEEWLFFWIQISALHLSEGNKINNNNNNNERKMNEE